MGERERAGVEAGAPWAAGGGSRSRSRSMEEARSKEVNENGLSLFEHSLPRFTLSEKLLLLLRGIILVPIRLVLSVTVMVITWTISVLGLVARDRHSFEIQPAVGWRGQCREMMYTLTSRGILWAIGFQLKVIGEQAPRQEAPVVIAAPHTSFIDVYVISICRGSPVARSENRSTPGMSAIQHIGHTIFVDRRSADSRQSALDSIVTRVTSPQPWPQVFIFSEGTTTNGTALIRFQTGGFKAGTAVQPVVIRYSHPQLTTWTRDMEHGFLASFLLLLATTGKWISVQFLPVVRPQGQEKQDPVLYARKVQEVMASSLGIPATDIQRREFVREVRKEK